MIYTTTDIKALISQNSTMSDPDIVAHLIDEWQASDQYKAMTAGSQYYRAKNDIKDRKITYEVNGVKHEDTDAANNKIGHSFHKLLVDQKASYAVGNPVVFKVEDEKQSDAINEVLGDDWNDVAHDWVKGAANRGQEWLHVFIDGDGDFNYMVVDGRQIIPIYDATYEKNLTDVIRFYAYKSIDPQGREVVLRRAEWWTSSECITYIEEQIGRDKTAWRVAGKADGVDPNPVGHFYLTNTANNTEESRGWGRVPFVCLPNNSECMTDLEPIKALIDDFDKNVSDASNNLEDIQELVWVLKGYAGTKLAEFRSDIKRHKAIKVQSDGGVDTKSADIPVEAREKHLQRLEDNIFALGRGVNPKDIKPGSSPSGVALQWMFSQLDMKADETIRKMKKALGEFMLFIHDWIDWSDLGEFKPEDVRFVFNKSRIANTAEQIENVVNSLAVTSRKTALANHPYVDDVQAELEQIEEESGEALPLDEPEIDA